MAFRVTDTILHRWLRVPYRLRVTNFRTPKKPRAVIVLIHGIGNTAQAWTELVHLLPRDVRVIGIDLLGFGDSPRPVWAQYSVKTQARAILWTLTHLRMTQRPIIVGHSLGALVAIELAKRYPLLCQQLVLCSPPFYSFSPVEKRPPIFSRDELLRRLYRAARRHPDQLIKLSPLAVKLGFANKSLLVNDENIVAYLSALEASIINQTSLRDVERVPIPIRILYGSLDPVVVGKYIKQLAVSQKNVSARQLLAGHEIIGPYTKALADELAQLVTKTK